MQEGSGGNRPSPPWPTRPLAFGWWTLGTSCNRRYTDTRTLPIESAGHRGGIPGQGGAAGECYELPRATAPQHQVGLPGKLGLCILPLQLLLLTFGAWVNRQQALIIDYLREENRVLKEQLGGSNLRLNDNQRRRLAAKGKALGRQLLSQVATIVTPDTILAWYRRLIAAKWTFKKKGIGRPGQMLQIKMLIVQMDTENPSWGYCRIQGALKNLGHQVAKSTIAKAIKEQGIKPAPDRPTSWRTFLRAHADVIVGAEFFTTEAWTLGGIVTFYTLFFIEHGTRIVTIAGPTYCPDESFMANAAIGLVDEVDGFLKGKQFLIIDRDAKFIVHFKEILKGAGIKIILAQFQAPKRQRLR